MFSGVDDQAWEITTRGAQPVPLLSYGAEEADTSVAACAQKSRSTQTSVLSRHWCTPYWTAISVFVRVSMFSSQEHRYLSLNSLITSLEGDPDLGSIPRVTT